MNVDVALADPVALFLFWIAIPVTFVSIAWWLTGRGRDSTLILAWAAATLFLATLTTWLAPRQDPVGAASAWGASGGAFLQMSLVLGSGLAAVALLLRRQRTRGVRVLTVGLVVRAVAAYVGVSLLLSIAIVALSIARDVAAVPVGRTIAVVLVR
jgi:hypothetical protein